MVCHLDHKLAKCSSDSKLFIVTPETWLLVNVLGYVDPFMLKTPISYYWMKGDNSNLDLCLNCLFSLCKLSIKNVIFYKFYLFILISSCDSILNPKCCNLSSWFVRM